MNKLNYSKNISEKSTLLLYGVAGKYHYLSLSRIKLRVHITTKISVNEFQSDLSQKFRNRTCICIANITPYFKKKHTDIVQNVLYILIILF
jgi:hypothetical protein